MQLNAMMHGDGGQMMSGGMGSWMVLWAVLAVAFVVLAVVATIWLVKHLGSGGTGSTGDDNAKVLERRYAAGEIDREDFLQRREDLARRA